MSTTTHLPVKLVLVANEEKHTSGEVTLQEWDSSDRMKRALKMFGMLWGAAVVSVLIPLAHFVLVPGFLIAGPIVAYFVYQNEKMILGGQGTCPNCGKPFTIAKGKVRWPMNDLCSECQSPAKISPT